MDDTGTVVAFWILAIITVGSALLTAAVRNLIHAVIFLIVSFMGVAGLYITLSADFIAVTQVLIYAGAISILLIFAIMLTPRSDRGNREGFLRLPALLLGGSVGATLIFVAVDTDWNIANPGSSTTGRAGDGRRAVGDALLDKYVLPFEIASVLLLVAMLGAIVLVRAEGAVEEQP